MTFKQNEALKYLISALLNILYKEIYSCEIVNPIELGATIDEKDTILDIKLRMNDNTLINLEMQTSQFEFWNNRSLYYLCGAYRNLTVGEEYRMVRSAKHIGILTKSPFPDAKAFYSEYYLTNTKNSHIYSGNFQYICYAWIR